MTAGRRLVLVSGPIASGETTVSAQLARTARTMGKLAATVDMDDVVAMLTGAWSVVKLEDRFRASQLAAAIVDRLFESGIEMAVVAGSTMSAYESDGLVGHLTSKPKILSIRLRVSLDESIRRAQADPARVRTLDGDFVARVYAAIDWTSVRQADLDLVTDSLNADQVAQAVEALVFETR
jgi:hypothetical protein